MPPNSTQNLNARLSLQPVRRSGPPGPVFAPPPIRNSASPVKIVGGPVRYRGGYHLNV
jgi:hypothetical protein